MRSALVPVEAVERTIWRPPTDGKTFTLYAAAATFGYYLFEAVRWYVRVKLITYELLLISCLMLITINLYRYEYIVQ